MNNNLKRNEIIHQIREYIPNELIGIRWDKEVNKVRIMFPNKNTSMVLTEYNTWDEIKRIIDKNMEGKPSECPICYSSDIIGDKSAMCYMCSTVWCLKCHFDMIKQNYGVVSCPFCRCVDDEKKPPIPKHHNEAWIKFVTDEYEREMLKPAITYKTTGHIDFTRE